MAKEELREFRVYNSMTQQKEVFTTNEPGMVSMYVCGITAYDFSHIGHARAAVNFDVLYRYLKHLGYEVTYVRNFTDVDDKIIRRANESGEDPFALSDRFCQEYLADMADLQCLSPTHQPRVSDHLEQIKDMITQIIKNGYGYVVDGDVFFSVEKFPNYGQLSGQKLENHRAGERVAVDSRKQSPFDFALWKAAKPGEPSWESPWGPGRPGWHIECSAMSAHYLTYKFDIHGGGIDLIFPHHENEVAQSCAACQESKISFWLHNGHVTNNNEKMSKSLGNFFTIRQITERYHPLVLRYFLISAHYRSPLNYTISQLDSGSDTIYYIYQTLQDFEDALSQHQGDNLTGGGKTAKKDPASSADAERFISNLRSEFQTRMADDLNTAHILTGAFQDALKCVNGTLTSLKKKPKKQQPLIVQSLISVKEELREVLDVLGLLSSSTPSEVPGLGTPGMEQKLRFFGFQNLVEYETQRYISEVRGDSTVQVLQELKDKALKRAGMVEDDILGLIEDRAQARKNKDFARSDQIRAELSSLGIALMDVGRETIWRPCIPVELAPLPATPEHNNPAPLADQKPTQQQVAQPPPVEQNKAVEEPKTVHDAQPLEAEK